MENSEKQWLLPEIPPADFHSKLGKLSPILRNLLFNRGIKTPEEIEAFLNPNYNKITDPFLFNEMTSVVERIFTAMSHGEKIVVYGDYDIDGITATAILHDVLSKLGARVETYIPSRFEEGYGLNKSALESLAKDGAAVVITVDSGIVAFEEGRAAKALGIDLIITDHHSPQDERPESFAILHPKVKGEKFPEKDLSGAGVAWKLASAIIMKALEDGHDAFVEGSEKWLLDLAALGTISDVVPLIGENRLIAYFGLIVLRQTRRPGLLALAEAAGIDIRKLDSMDIGFILGPRLNASGRLEHAKLSLELLITENARRAREIARELNELNAKRQALTKKIYLEAKELAAKETGSNVVFLASEEWSHGVVGIVASRISEEFGKPAFIAEKNSEGIKGSARAGNGFDLVAMMRKADGLWDRYGGHKFAAGFTFQDERFDEIKKILEDEASKIGTRGAVIQTDGELSLSELNEELIAELKKLEPYGEKNPKPVFIVKGELRSKRKVGDGSHLKITLTEGGKFVGLVAFGHGHLFDLLENNSPIESLATIEMNHWNGVSSIELKARDLRMSKVESS